MAAPGAPDAFTAALQQKTEAELLALQQGQQPHVAEATEAAGEQQQQQSAEEVRGGRHPCGQKH